VPFELQRNRLGATLAIPPGIMDKKDLSIAAPCNADWRKMTPADGGRFCGDCKKVVRDLSTMRERDARTLLRANDNASLCVRYLYDKHGKIFFAGDRAPAVVVPASFLQRAKRVALSAAAVAVPLSLAACSPSAGATSGIGGHDDQQPSELYENMGGAPAMPDDHEHDDDGGADAATPDGGDAGDAGTGDGGDASDAAPDAETPI
jgi:hypothetical protein